MSFCQEILLRNLKEQLLHMLKRQSKAYNVLKQKDGKNLKQLHIWILILQIPLADVLKSEYMPHAWTRSVIHVYIACIANWFWKLFPLGFGGMGEHVEEDIPPSFDSKGEKPEWWFLLLIRNGQAQEKKQHKPPWQSFCCVFRAFFSLLDVHKKTLT